MQADSLTIIRDAVAAVSARDLSSHSADDSLDLDSIHRITLIVELENLFDITIGDENLSPEAFDTLGTLQEFIEGVRCGSAV